MGSHRDGSAAGGVGDALGAVLRGGRGGREQRRAPALGGGSDESLLGATRRSGEGRQTPWLLLLIKTNFVRKAEKQL